MLQVTKTYLPSKKKFLKYVDAIWQNHILTNNGPLLKQLEDKLKTYSGCSNVLACANGTVVLQMALRAMNITKEVITTPFSYVATTNAILWEQCKPVFVDINKTNFTIDVKKIEQAITKDTQAILATHVYGHPCDVAAIGKIAAKHKLKVIYDGAHSFGATYKGKSLLSFGDITTCSFHATKLFHSAEDGALFINSAKYAEPLSLLRSFGHIYDDYYCVGTNSKMSELHAAMGLSVIDDINKIIKKLKGISLKYDKYLNNNSTSFSLIKTPEGNNYGYYAILFKNEKLLKNAMAELAEHEIFPRRYFFPSLNELPFLKKTNACPVSENISRSVLCLPLSQYITEKQVKKVCRIINKLK